MSDIDFSAILCKHNDLIVQRNYGHRWVTCTVCHTDFLPAEEPTGIEGTPDMSSFDFSDIERVNRIELQPNEMVLFQTSVPMGKAEVHEFRTYFDHTPLEGRVLLISGDVKVATVVVPSEDES